MSDVYDYHLAIYSKLIRGHNPDGPVRPGVEARLVGSTPTLPDQYQDLCTTSLFFPENPPVTQIDPRIMQGGAFVYIPVFLRGEHLGVFARIEARPERGKGKGGRSFTHSAILIVREKWEPGLITWAARMLFSTDYGGRNWGLPIYEHQEQPRYLSPPVLGRGNWSQSVRKTSLLPAVNLSESSRVRLAHPRAHPDEGRQLNQLDFADWLVSRLDDSDHATQGRFLSFASGISKDIKGPGESGFFIALDTRDRDDVGTGYPLGFRDPNPAAFIFSKDRVNRPSDVHIPNWRTMKSRSAKESRLRDDTITDRNFWPEQIAMARAETPRQPAAEDTADLELEFRQTSRTLSPAADIRSVPQPRHEPAGISEAETVVEGRSAQDIRDTETDRNVVSIVGSAPRETAGEIDEDHEVPYHNEWEEDPIEWPHLLKYEDHPDEYIHPVSRDMLDWCKQAFGQLVARLELIADAPFDQFPDDDHANRIIVNAFGELFEFIVNFSAAGRDPNELRDDIKILFRHAELTNLGIGEGAMNGVICHMLRYILQIIDVNEIMHEVDRINRRERELAKYNQFSRGVQIRIDIPNEAAIRNFFGWLSDHQLNIVDPVKYNIGTEAWWTHGLKPYFVEQVAKLQETLKAFPFR